MPQNRPLILPPAQQPPVDVLGMETEPVEVESGRDERPVPRSVPVSVAPKRQQTTKRRLRILILSTYGESGVPMALRLLQEGHFPELFILQEECRLSGKGIVPLIDSFPGRFTDYDLLVCSDKNFGRIVEECGIPAFGPTREAEKLEDNRQHGMEIMEQHGIRVPAWKFFTDLAAAEPWLKQHGRAVFKPNGDQAPKFLTYAAKQDDNSDLLGIMKFAEDVYPEVLQEGFVLQEFKNGIEVSSGSYFNGHDFLMPLAVNFEHKSFGMKPFSGLPTGEMGSASYYTQSSRLFREVTAKMTPYLRKIKYHGDFDVNCIVTEEGPYALEMTPRIGFPTIALQMSAFVEDDFGYLLYETAKGTATKVTVKQPWVVGVLLTCPPFPYDDEVKDPHSYEGWPVSGPLLMNPDLHPLAVQKKENKVLTSGIGLICIACGSGNTVEEAKKKAYVTLEKVYVPYRYARNDIADRVLKDMPDLKKLGYF